MKHPFAIIAFAGLVAISLISCSKDEVHSVPKISFLTDSGYVFIDTTVQPGATLWTGIMASRIDSTDRLTNFSVTKRVNNEPELIVFDQPLSGLGALTYQTSYQIKTRNQPGEEQYIYRLTNQDRETRQVQLTVTVK